jgi:hypothetical protein
MLGFRHYIISPILIPKIKAQLPVCFIKKHAINAYEWRRREIALIVLNLGPRLRRVVSFTARLLYSRRYILWKLFRRRMCGPKCHSRYLVKGKNPFPLPNIERRFLNRPARGLVNCAGWDISAVILITIINILIVSKHAKHFFVIKPTRCTNFTSLFWHETLHVSDSPSVHHQEFIHCTLSSGICHTGL